MNLDLKFDTFQKARIELSAWYVGVLLLLVISFSTALYFTQVDNFARIVLRREYGDALPRQVSYDELVDLQRQTRELRQSFINNLIFIDVSLLLCGALFSYMLAGRTLRPIQNTLDKQKEFIADASHELRTPLTAIQTSTEIALRYEQKSVNEYKEVIKSTHEEVLRLGKLVEDLLLLSKIDTGITPINNQNISLKEIIEPVVSQMQIIAERKSITLKTHLESDIKLQIDPDHLKQILVILLDNAIKFSPEETDVSIHLSAQPYPSISILDRGPGIPYHDQKRIFERFYQSDKSRNVAGSGLGLSIANQLAEKNGASLKVKSKPGKGSTFILQFRDLPHYH
jgi:signal transduction histidine kinase